MEKKKLLLVAVSVGVFLVIVISAALLIFTPRAGIGSGTAVATGRPIAPGTTGILPPEEPYFRPETPLEAPPAGVSSPGMPSGTIYTTNQESNVYISGDRPGDAAKPVVKSEETPGQVTVNIVKPSAAAVPNTPSVAAAPQSASPAPAAAAAPKPVAASKPAAATPPKPAAAAPKPATAAPKPAAAPSKPAPAAAAAKPASPRKSDYWVQTGAFSTQVRAEGAKETLADKGITSIIENRQVDGKLWYRVRVGPYTSESEANYWLALVKSIDGFGESQVRQTLR